MLYINVRMYIGSEMSIQGRSIDVRDTNNLRLKRDSEVQSGLN